MASDREEPIGDAFGRVASSSPDRVIIVDGRLGWTAGDIWAAGTAATHRYRSAGVGATSRVGVFAWPPGDFLVDLLALAAVGSTVVPLPREMTAWELDQAIDLASLTHLSGGARRDDGGREVLDTGARRLLERCIRTSAVPETGAATAQLTSGTSGMAKVALRSSNALAFEATGYRDVLGLGPDEVIVSTLPLHHAYGFGLCVLAAAVAGVTVHHVGPGRPRVLLRRLQDLDRVLLPTVPPMARLIGRAAAGIAQRLPDVRVLTAGMPLDRRTADLVSGGLRSKIGQVYGTTETGPIAVRPPSPSAERAHLVGAPLPGVEVRLDPTSAGLPDEGVVAVRSPSVMLGYDDGDPMPGVAAGGWFTTGDLGRMHGGELALVGRLSNCVNVGGAKVSPEEIESALLEHPSVEQALVTGVADDALGQRVKATVAPRDVDPEELRAFIRERLSTPKWPSIIEVVESLPTTATGKVLRNALLPRPGAADDVDIAPDRG
jgi:acyl-CoA synthetase (AMP-forming)/AMP-acid ligase II